MTVKDLKKLMSMMPDTAEYLNCDIKVKTDVSDDLYTVLGFSWIGDDLTCFTRVKSVKEKQASLKDVIVNSISDRTYPAELELSLDHDKNTIRFDISFDEGDYY